ncbi:MAG: hypothetical protein LBG64_01915 [Pseudomonadales bacterium]|jgi:ribosomal protein L28|nr:hypothetical protein [Pseudomonadales bacterium]
MSSFAVKYPRVAHWGHKVSHAKNRTNRGFKYNLQVVTVIDDSGKKVRMKVPAKIIRTLKRAGVTTHFKKSS